MSVKHQILISQQELDRLKKLESNLNAWIDKAKQYKREANKYKILYLRKIGKIKDSK